MKKLLLFVIFAVYLFAGDACAKDKYYEPGDTYQLEYWSDAANWTDGTLPLAGDNVYIASDNNWSLSLDVDATALAQVRINNKSLIIGDDRLFNASGINVGLYGSGYYEQLGRNSVTNATGLYLGVFSGSSGQVRLLNDDSTINVWELYVGNNGKGELFHEGGHINVGYDASADVYDLTARLEIASNTGTEGEYVLSNGELYSSHMYVSTSGQGEFSQSGGNVYVGYHPGSGEYTLGSNMILGRNSGVTGKYYLSAGNLYLPELIVGHFGEGEFNQSGGHVYASYKNSDPGSIAPNLYLGNHPDSYGAYNLSADGILTTNLVAVGYCGSGVFNQSGGLHEVLNDLTVGSQSGSAGTYTLTGGSLDVDNSIIVKKDSNSRGVFDYSGGDITAGSIVNNGTFNILNGGTEEAPLVVKGNVQNYGEFKVTNSVVEFKDSFVNSNGFYSDPSGVVLNDLTVNPGGFISAGADQFIVKGDFINKSAQADSWRTGDAHLAFSQGSHNVVFNSIDLGATSEGYLENYSWGDVSFNNGTFVLGQLDDGTWGALYTDTLSGLAIDGDLITNVNGGSNIYYMADSNAWLDGKIYSFSGGGQLRPVGVVPEPVSCVLFLVGGGALAVVRKR